MTVQPQNYNLNYLIDPTFTNVIIEYLFCHFKELLKKIIQQKVIEIFFTFYVPNVKMKDSNVLIDGKSFFDLPVKNEEEAYEKIMNMSNNNDYTTGNLLGFVYF